MESLHPSSDETSKPRADREPKSAFSTGEFRKDRSSQEIRVSEFHYRRFFEAARDGILILDPDTRKITDSNPFMTELLGYSKEELRGKELWEIGLLKDEEASRAAFRELQDIYYVRYDDLPLQSKTGRSHQVEFVSNLYEENGRKVIQCNIRDITDRKRAEEVVRGASSEAALKRERKSLIELVVIIVLTVLVYAGSRATDAFDPVFRYLADKDAGMAAHMDEIVVSMMFFCLAMAVFSLRRWRESKEEVGSQTLVAAALRSLHRDLETRVGERTAELVKANEALHAEIAERKRATHEVTLLATSISHINEIIVITDATPIDEPGPKIVFANHAFERITGYSPEEVIGRSPRFLQGPRTDPLILQDIRQALQEERPIRRQIINYRKDGSEHVMDVDIVPVFETGGKCTHYVAVEHDITEEMRAERMLRESERRFREVLENVDLIALSLDKKGVITFCNDYLLKLTGWTREELAGADCFSILVPETEKPVRKLFFDRLVSGNFPSHYENAIKTKDGERRLIRWSNTMLRDEEENIIGLTAIGEDVTEQQKARELLLWKTALFEAMVHSASDGILIVDSEGDIVLQNQKMIELWGIPEAIVEHMNRGLQLEWASRQIKNPTRFAEKVAYLSDHPNETSHDETELLNGKVLDRYSAPVQGEDGTYYGRIWSFRDITERKRTEEALIQSERKFRQIFDQANDGIFMVHNGVYVDSNLKGLALLGVTREEFIGKSPMAFSPKTQPDGRDSVETIREHIERVMRGEPQFFDWIHCRPDGTPVHVEVGLNRLDLGGETYIQSIVRDISARKEAEAQIAEQAALLDKAQDAIIVRDLEGAIKFWNKGAERIYGWTQQEALGRNIGELLYVDPKKFKEINHVELNHGEWHGEFLNHTKDGRELTIEARRTLIHDAEGRPKSVLAIYSDVTAQKMIEAQFLRAQRMESIGTLAGGIAHDLNNILAPIIMSIDLLKQLSTDPQADSILETIDVSAKRGADIVRQVLSYARGMEGERVEILPKSLLNELEHIIKNTFPKDIRMQFSVPDDTWPIVGDRTQVHQVLLNLCVNARDAMPNGGKLTVSVENRVLDEQYVTMNIQATAGCYVKIAVSDSGTGIAPTVIDKIFEPFFTTKDISKGTGLGLSTVMAIVKSHGGTINVYSEEGKGTTFTVFLPAMETSIESLGEPSERADWPRGNGETVLVVDDEASILTITSQTLQNFGYRVLTAADGADALGIYVQNKSEIAVVLTDMMMPVLDGPSTIRALLRINPAVKIIAASGLNMDGTAKASRTGVRHFLIKPYTAEILLKTMRMIVDEA